MDFICLVILVLTGISFIISAISQEVGSMCEHDYHDLLEKQESGDEMDEEEVSLMYLKLSKRNKCYKIYKRTFTFASIMALPSLLALIHVFRSF